MKYDYKKKNTGLYVYFSVFALVLFLLTASVIPFMGRSKGLVSVDLLLCLVCVLSAYAGRRFCCIFAVILGLFADLFLFAPTAFSPIVYLTASLITPVFHGYFSRLGSLVLAVCSFPAIVLRCAVGIFSAATAFKNAGLGAVIAENALPMLIVNFAWAIVICFICRKLIYRLGLK